MLLQSDIERHVRPEYQRMLVNSEIIGLEKYELMRMNSYEREFLLPLFDDEVLIKITEYCIQNCSASRYRIATTYDEALKNLAKELIKRLRNK